MLKTFSIFLLALLIPVTMGPRTRERVYFGYSPEQVFQAALSGAMENFSVTDVDEKNQTFTFHTAMYPNARPRFFDLTLSAVETKFGAKLVLQVPMRCPESMRGATDRIADALFQNTERILEMESLD
jgi:hypothetical protein